ncbi:hypothetical protein [Streptosporangium sp. NPDC049644]|uniref:hypothetical protein n=1 Tax=Streptosporangium sp. NPDC049644 TaxID=3155507 RepID=UPI003431FDA4
METQSGDNYEWENFSQENSKDRLQDQLVPFMLGAANGLSGILSHELVETYSLLREEIRKQTHRLHELENENNVLHSRVDELWQLFEGVDARLAQLLEKRTVLREDLTSADTAAHLENSQIYRNLVEQRVQALVRRGLKRGSEDRRFETIAKVMSAVCRWLLLPELDRDKIQGAFKGQHDPSFDGMVTDVCEQALKIRGVAQSAAGEQSWMWDYEAGAFIDPSFQDTWSSCDSEHPIKFLIAPAYVVDKQIYCPQIVFTGKGK